MWVLVSDNSTRFRTPHPHPPLLVYLLYSFAYCFPAMKCCQRVYRRWITLTVLRFRLEKGRVAAWRCAGAWGEGVGSSVQFSSVQDGIYALGKAHNYTLHPVSQKFPQRCLWNGSYVRLTDDGPLSFFEGRSSNASSFHVSLLKAVDGVMSLALCSQIVSQCLP